jgi:pilus assembly protein CpaF
MSWVIKDKNNNKEGFLADKKMITIGSSEECDIIIPEKSKAKIHCQIFLENGFIFRENFNSKNVSYQKDVFYSDNHTIEFEYKNENSFLLPDEIEITTIFSSHLFKTALTEVQTEFSKNPSFITDNICIKESSFMKASCYYLNQIFWEKKSIYQQYDRNLFQKTIWCMWAQAFGLGVLTLAIHDDTVSEIMVNHAKNIYLERNGTLHLSELKFDSNGSLMAIIERICNQVGRRIDESIPFCDARLSDGSRVHAIIPPLSLNGPCLTIRKFPKHSITFSGLIEKNSIPESTARFLKEIVALKKNILISGGTGSGKTTLLNCLTAFIDPNERIITIEDSAELKLQQPHTIRLESRKENIEQKGSVSIRELVKNALRMRPDRIIIGECRGGEALDMLQAMNTGHDGSMTTIHSNSAQDALRRLETLVLFASSELPSKAIREQIASAIHFVIQLSRHSKGHRCVTAIHEIISLCDISNKFITKPIYELIL